SSPRAPAARARPPQPAREEGPMAPEERIPPTPGPESDAARTTALVLAIDRGDAEAARNILEALPALSRAVVRQKDPRGETLLHYVIPGDGEPLTEAHVAIAALLLDAGADVNARGYGKNNEDAPALMIAAHGGHAPLVRLLVARG